MRAVKRLGRWPATYPVPRWGLMLVAGFAALLGSRPPAQALVFDVSYEPSVAGAPAGFIAAFDDALQGFEGSYGDPIGVNISIGWGTLNGKPLGAGVLGRSVTNQAGFYSYDQIKSFMQGDARSAQDAVAMAAFAKADPTGGSPFVMANAEAKALGLLDGKAPGIDGWIGFSDSTAFSFDPDHRGMAGTYDFIGVAQHEISEVLGRYGVGQNGGGGAQSPLDLFRYQAPGAPELSAIAGSYFSIDGGITPINWFNGGAGDPGDWQGLTADAFNDGFVAGLEQGISPGDITVMDAIGYDLIDTVAEPASLSLFGLALTGLVLLRRPRSVPTARWRAASRPSPRP